MTHKLKISIARDPATIERSNLVNICKLVVKELLEQSLRFGRMLDSDHLPLQHFFIVLEHVLRHGLRPKKGLLGPKKELWDVVQSVEKYCPLAQDITDSVRNLPTVKTALGRARYDLFGSFLLRSFYKFIFKKGLATTSRYAEKASGLLARVSGEERYGPD